MWFLGFSYILKYSGIKNICTFVSRISLWGWRVLWIVIQNSVIQPFVLFNSQQCDSAFRELKFQKLSEFSDLCFSLQIVRFSFNFTSIDLCEILYFILFYYFLSEYTNSKYTFLYKQLNSFWSGLWLLKLENHFRFEVA